ncbi:MAG: helix-turn-helix domain-containing protein [Gammaproteobacteria bacterium]|nr:helix-turn-helix domain-containing protein [Gammaproteobacteria bacterium]
MYTIEDGMLHYKSCGLPDVWLKGGFVKEETPYGETISIHDMDGLHKVLGIKIAKDKPHLSSKEFRFLRIELDMSQNTLANILGVSESTIRNWENDRTNEITLSAERLLRTIYITKVNDEYNGDCHIRELVEHISQLNRDAHWGRMELIENKDGWSAHVAA